MGKAETSPTKFDKGYIGQVTNVGETFSVKWLYKKAVTNCWFKSRNSIEASDVSVISLEDAALEIGRRVTAELAIHTEKFVGETKHTPGKTVEHTLGEYVIAGKNPNRFSPRLFNDDWIGQITKVTKGKKVEYDVHWLYKKAVISADRTSSDIDSRYFRIITAEQVAVKIAKRVTDELKDRRRKVKKKRRLASTKTPWDNRHLIDRFIRESVRCQES